jgi:D-sedoheptulose 7-phosphate isomerase
VQGAPNILVVDNLVNGSLATMFEKLIEEHIALFSTLPNLSNDIERAGMLMTEALSNGLKLMFCGNGGSAADSQHIAAEFIGRFVLDRVPLAALALSTDTSVLTCIGNDYGFEKVFERQILALGASGDILVVISTSGNSANIINAVAVANSKGVNVIGLLGRDGGKLKQMCDVAIIVPSNVTARIQEAHIFIGHCLCSIVESRLGFAR